MSRAADRPGRRGLARWALTACAVAGLVAWLGSGRIGMIRATGTHAAGLRDGRVYYWHVPSGVPDVWEINATEDFRLDLSIDALSMSPRTWSLHIPLWVAVVLPGGPALWMWHGHRRRHRPDACRRCGYLLTGLVDDVPTCPECGRRQPRPDATRAATG